MNIRPCPADRARAMGRIRRGPSQRVRRQGKDTVEVKLGCGCVFTVDFVDPELAAALYKSLKH